MSTNAPVLQLILAKLANIEQDISGMKQDISGMKQDISGMKQDISGLRTAVTELQNYNQNAARIQEREFTNQLKSYLLEKYPGAAIRTRIFGIFYKKHSNDPLTDIDGCVLLWEPPFVMKQNGKNVQINASCMYIIEAKHAITKALLDKKINQFVYIMNAITYIKSAKYKPGRSKFDEMVDVQKIKELPESICFLMSTEKITPDALQILLQIATGSLTRESYNELLFEYAYNHKLMKDILDDESVDRYVKDSITGMKSLQDMYRIVQPEAPGVSEKKSQQLLYKKKSTILPYTAKLLQLLTPYDEYVGAVGHLKGNLGFISKNEIQFPEDLMRNGFRSVNRLLTASQTNYVKSVPW
jgi:hypothetical protein